MSEPITQIVTPTSLDYTFTAGGATERFLRGLKDGKILGQRCPKCQLVIVPARGACARCGVPTEDDVELADTGTMTTYTIVHIPVPGSDVKPPFVAATIFLDGADIGLFHLVHEVSLDKIRPGMRVKASWKPQEDWGFSLTNIRYFVPLDEPDVDVTELERRIAHA